MLKRFWSPKHMRPSGRCGPCIIRAALWDCNVVNLVFLDDESSSLDPVYLRLFFVDPAASVSLLCVVLPAFQLLLQILGSLGLPLGLFWILGFLTIPYSGSLLRFLIYGFLLGFLIQVSYQSSLIWFLIQVSNLCSLKKVY